MEKNNLKTPRFDFLWSFIFRVKNSYNQISLGLQLSFVLPIYFFFLFSRREYPLEWSNFSSDLENKFTMQISTPALETPLQTESRLELQAFSWFSVLTSQSSHQLPLEDINSSQRITNIIIKNVICLVGILN